MTIQQAMFGGKSNPNVTLQSGTDFTSSAVYTAAGVTVYWWQITLAGVVSSLGQSSTINYAGRLGNKLFATYLNDSSLPRSNYVGQFFWQDFTSGSSKTSVTIPASIPGVSDAGEAISNSSYNLVGYLWGGTGRNSSGTNGGGGYTDFAGPILAGSTIWVICAGAGYRGGANDSSRDADCKGKSSQGGWSDNGGGLSGVFTSDPLDGSNAPLLTPTSTAILGIAGGGGACYNNGYGGGGGGSSGQSSNSSSAGGGGTQSAGGSNATDATVRNPDFMTGGVLGGTGGGTATAGGGGGYYGGGGTFRNGGLPSCGGGGGSGYFRNTGGYSGQTIQATDRNAANNGSDYYPGNNVGYGLSGSGDQGTGNRGQVRIYLR